MSEKSKYNVVLKIDSKEYKASGDSVYDAINKLKLEKITYKGLLKVSKGKLTFEKLYFVPKLRLLLGNDVAKQVAGKFFEQLLRNDKA